MAKNFQVKCAPCVEGLTAYAVPRHQAPIDLRLDGNEGSWPPLEIMARMVDEGVSLIRNYPSRASFESCLAKRFNTTSRNVLATCGGDDALERACRAVLAPGRNMILPVPTFEMLERYARLIGAEVRKTPWLSGAFPIERVLSLLDENTGAVCVVSPNNPTGEVASAKDVRELSARAPQALIILDLAYVEFADEDLTSLALSLPNVVAVRSLSKAWGLAGARVGYAVGPEEVIAWMKAVGGPYSVSGPSLRIAEQRVSEGADEAHVFVRRIRAEREVLERELKDLGAEPLRSQANFVCSKFRDAVWVWEALAGLGIAVRHFPGNEDLTGYLRITCPGDEKAFARLLHALSAALRPEAVLFDLDGVLADVSSSYREAILLTARAFGAELRPSDISEAKALGNANNDWELTRRLLEKKGIKAPLDEVTRCFEEFYQGSSGNPGLCEQERLIPDISVLKALRARVKLGVVTGRPRKDAEKFISRAGIGELMDVLICMEDAALKPSPEPVELALKRLGVKCAWFVGDTPDDVRAAQGAWVVPIGILAPGEDRECQSQALLSAGAGRVLNEIGDLLEVLS